MAFDALESLDREGLLEYIRSLLWQYRLADAFWFLKVEEEYGQRAAETLNARVWGKVGELSARDIVKRFGPFEPGPGETAIDAFLAAYALFPWAMLVDYEFTRHSACELEISVADCPPQTARLRRGLGEYHCKEMHRAEFEGFARTIDPALKVECRFAPPDPHPADRFCTWAITCPQEGRDTS